MRVHVYKRIKGESMVLVEPSRRSRLSPVILRGITSENRAERVLAAVVAASRRVSAQPGPAGL